MKMKHFFRKNQILGQEKEQLVSLINDCDLIYDKSVDTVINEIDDKSLICVYDQYGEMCGFASILDEGNNIYLADLYVHPSSRGKHYGKALLNAISQYSEKLGYKTTTLSVGLQNKSAQKIYEKYGYIYTGNNTSLAHMKQYNSKSIYAIAGILHETAKKHGVENLLINAKKMEEPEKLYKYLNKKDAELLERCRDSSLLETSAMLIEELLGGNALLADSIMQGDLKMVEGTKFSNAKNLKKSALCVNCFLELGKQEKIKSRIEEKQKTI